MKYLLVLFAVPVLSAGECGSGTKNAGTPQETADSIPPCVRKIIDAGEKGTPSNGPLEVNEYLYNNKTVYLFTARCCDQFNVLYDANCNTICAPSGGFSGRGDGKCPDFEKNAKLVKLIWKSDKQ